MTPEHWETVRAVLILLGGLATGIVTSKTVRKSQKESSQITLLTNLIDQLQEERDKAVDRADREQSAREAAEHQVPLWRKLVRKLRSQVYKLGAEPVESDDDLDI
jgi:23S rRNA maturation mini-RNase III